jgi:hypothetical protein
MAGQKVDEEALLDLVEDEAFDDATVEDEDAVDERLTSPGEHEPVSDLLILSVPVVQRQPHEFVCASCYLVRHRSQLVEAAPARCRDCA